MQYENLKTLKERRLAFKAKKTTEDIIYDKVIVTGETKSMQRFIYKSITKEKKTFSLNHLKKQYFRLMSDDKIKSAYPTTTLDTVTGKYLLKLNIKKEKPFFLDVGGNLSNRPISNFFMGLQYNHIGKVGFTAYANGYLGKLNSSALGKLRIEFPTKIPFYLESVVVTSRWDYYKSSALFYNFEKPSFLIIDDVFGELNVGAPVGNIGKVVLTGGLSEWKNRYYQTETFTKLDTNDVSFFDFGYTQLAYQINTLNKKQYATEGTNFLFRVKMLNGRESYFAGSTSPDTLKKIQDIPHSWLNIKLSLDKYIKPIKYFKVGVFAEGVYSTQPFFRNYKSTILSAPAFNPIPESQTIFVDDYRAHQYVAGGLKLIASPLKVLDIRFEGYFYQPIYSILKTSNEKANYSTALLYNHFLGMAAFVYHSPIGPLSLGLNYYDKTQNNFSFFFHIGYTIYNKKSMD